MSERERWIIYPLLFLALGAALRDKLINSTESQRVKCQGLMVYDSSGDVSMVLGAEQFPDVRQQTVRSHLKLDTIEVATLRVTDNVSFRRIMYEDRDRGVTYSIDGQHVIGLLAWVDSFQRSAGEHARALHERFQQMAQKLRENSQPPIPPQVETGTPNNATPQAPAEGARQPESAPQESAPTANPAVEVEAESGE